MSGIYIPSDKIPTKCWGCTFRDPEYGGDCVLMPSFDAGTYEEQLERCPFKEIRNWFGGVPEHGPLVDALDVINAFPDEFIFTNEQARALTNYIIPADPAKDGEG